MNKFLRQYINISDSVKHTIINNYLLIKYNNLKAQNFNIIFFKEFIFTYIYPFMHKRNYLRIMKKIHILMTTVDHKKLRVMYLVFSVWARFVSI